MENLILTLLDTRFDAFSAKFLTELLSLANIDLDTDCPTYQYLANLEGPPKAASTSRKIIKLPCYYIIKAIPYAFYILFCRLTGFSFFKGYLFDYNFSSWDVCITFRYNYCTKKYCTSYIWYSPLAPTWQRQALLLSSILQERMAVVLWMFLHLALLTFVQ